MNLIEKKQLDNNDCMQNRLQDINDLFSMFHDFDITGLTLDDEVLTMEIIIPWGALWNIEDYKMTFRFRGCTKLECRYWRRTSTALQQGEKGTFYPTEKFTTSNPDEIAKLALIAESSGFKAPNNYFIYCSCCGAYENEIGQINYGEIELNATDYQIFDRYMNEITIETMKSWGTKWWQSIKDMWDEQDRMIKKNKTDQK